MGGLRLRRCLPALQAGLQIRVSATEQTLSVRGYGLAVASLVACLAAGCDTIADEARREYFKALELSKTGHPQEERLAHVDRAVQLAPTAAGYLELRANLIPPPFARPHS